MSSAGEPAGSGWSFEDSPLARSFLWGLAITTLPALSGFAVSWVVARWAGPDVLGTISWVMSFATAVLIVGKFGLDLAASRLASEYGVASPGALRSLFATAFGLRVVFTIGVAVVTVVFSGTVASFFKNPSLETPIRIGGLIVVCASFYEFSENFLIGLNRLATVYKIRALHLLSRVAVTLLLVVAGAGAARILGGYCAAWLIAIVTYAILLARFLPRGDAAANKVELKRLMTLSATLAVSAASVTIYTHMDRLMLGYFSGVEEVGQFAVARNITEVSLFPAFALAMMLRPALASRVSAGRLEDCGGIIRTSLRFSFVFGVLFAAIFAAVGTDLVTFVFSTTFEPAGQLMVFFVGIVLLRSAGAVMLPGLIAIDQARVYAYLTAGSAIFNFFLNVLLIPRFASRGAIAATVISYGCLLLFGLGVMLSKYRVSISLAGISVAVRTILAGSAAGYVTWWISARADLDSWGSLVWAVLLSVLYLVLIYILRVASFSNVSELLTNLRKQKR